jgi:hypothetical protein
MLTPDEMKMLESLPTLAGEEAALQRQLAQAAALRNRPMPEFSTPWGQAFGSLGHVIGRARGALTSGDLNAKVGDVRQKMSAGEALKARLEAMKAQQGLQAGEQQIGAQKADMERKAAEAERAGQAIAPELAAMLGQFMPGRDFASLTYRDMEKMLGPLTALSGKQEAAKDRALQREMMRGAREDRIRQGLEEREVGGYDFSPGRIPSKDNAQKFTQAVTAVNGMRGDLDALEENFKAHGTESLFGANQARQSGARESIMLQLKELQNLGVLNGKDYEILSRIVPDTSSPTAMLSKNSTLAAQFGEFRRQLENRLQAGASTMGYAKKGGAGAPAGGAVSAPSGLTPEEAAELQALEARFGGGK